MRSVVMALAVVTAFGLGAPRAQAGVTASGGTVTNYIQDGRYWAAHVFTNAGTFDVTRGGNVDVLLVGGGGGGGGGIGGGGGGGGVVHLPEVAVSAGGSYPLTVGAGGGGGVGQNRGATGTGSTAFGATAAGGGGGGYYPDIGGLGGGAGGGAGGAQNDTPAGGGTGGCALGGNSGTIYENNGGSQTATRSSSANSARGGGGAGAAAADEDCNTTPGGNGGVGTTNAILGVNYFWAGGGAGAAYQSYAGGNGGLGGGGGGASFTTAGGGLGGGSALRSGGNGGVGANAGGGAGGANTGGGGGGGTWEGSTGGRGGAGIVIVRYALPFFFSPPVVSNVTTTTAEASTTLGGTNGNVYLVWDTSDRGTTLTAWAATNALGALEPGPIDGAALTGLAIGTEYTCRFFATNSTSGDSDWSPTATFRTGGPPLIATLPESGVTYNSAVLNGNVISTGRAPTTVRAYWAETDQYPNYDGWLGTSDFGAVHEGTTNTVASALAYNTAYVYRYYATNEYGEAWGDAETFATPYPPPVTFYFNNTNGDWNTAAHWNPQQVPSERDTAYIRDSRIATLGEGAGGVASNLNIGVSIGGGGNAGTLNVLGTLAVGGGMTLASGHDTWGAATATVDQGTGTVVTVGGSLTVGSFRSNTGDGGLYRVGTNANLSVGGNLKVAANNSCGGTLVQSAGSAVDIAGSLYVGNVGSTHLTSYGQGGFCIVPSNATLRLTGAASSLYIAYGQNSYGTLAYNSTVGTLNIPGSVVIGSGDGTWGHSAGTLALGPGAAITIGGSLTAGASYSSVGDGGVVNVTTGATLTVTGATAVASGASPRGRINVTGGTARFVGNLTLGAGGRLDVNSGAAHLPRATTVGSGATLACQAGRLVFGIGGDPASGQSDKVTVNAGGVMDLGGDLQVELEGGFRPESSNSYTIVQSSGTLNGVFDNAPVSGSWYRLGYVEAVVTYNADSVVLSDWRDAPDGFMLIVR